MSSTTTGPNDYSSSHRSRCRGELAGCETRRSSTHEEHEEEQEQERERAQLSIVAMLLDTVRRSLLASCQAVKKMPQKHSKLDGPLMSNMLLMLHSTATMVSLDCLKNLLSRFRLVHPVPGTIKKGVHPQSADCA